MQTLKILYIYLDKSTKVPLTPEHIDTSIPKAPQHSSGRIPSFSLGPFTPEY